MGRKKKKKPKAIKLGESTDKKKNLPAFQLTLNHHLQSVHKKEGSSLKNAQ